MICLIALLVFGILGVFSATHRKIAIEAFECVFKRIRLKPCDSGLDKRLKSQITGKLIKRNSWLARFIFRHFEAISWFFTILMIVSIVYSGAGIYNFAIYGNCNGEDSQETCIYAGLADTLKIDVECESPLCQNMGCECEGEIACLEGEGDLCEGGCNIEGG